MIDYILGQIEKSGIPEVLLSDSVQKIENPALSVSV